MKCAWREKRAATKWQKCNRSAQKLTVAAAVTTTTTTTTDRVIPEMATEWPKKGANNDGEGGMQEEKAFRVSCKKPFNACCILLGYACPCLCMGE